MNNTSTFPLPVPAWPRLPQPRFFPARDKIPLMRKREKESKGQDSTREQWRVPLTIEEADRVTKDSLNLELNKGKTKAAYMRQVLLSPLDPSTPIPEFPPIRPEDEIERPTRPSVRLEADEVRQIEEAAQALGIDAKRYARWRLLGVTK